MINTTPLVLIFDVVTAVVGVACVAVALTGFFKTHLTIIEKVLFAAGGILLVMTKIHYVVIGLIFIILAYFLQKRKAQPISSSV